MEAPFPAHPATRQPLSRDAHQILGTLAACTWSGPHRAQPLRRWTNLTPAAFDGALRELAERGLVQLQERDVFWVTGPGEAQAERLFS